MSGPAVQPTAFDSSSAIIHVVISPTAQDQQQGTIGIVVTQVWGMLTSVFTSEPQPPQGVEMRTGREDMFDGAEMLRRVASHTSVASCSQEAVGDFNPRAATPVSPVIKA